MIYYPAKSNNNSAKMIHEFAKTIYINAKTFYIQTIIFYIIAKGIYTKAIAFSPKKSLLNVQTKHSDSKTLANYKGKFINLFHRGGN